MPRKAKKRPAAKAARSPIVAIVRRNVNARYDAAQITDDNRRHFANADALSAGASISAEVRRRLRNYSRYEVKNNSYAKGIGLTIANDTIGSGPTLQLLGVDRATKKFVETLFWRWMREINLPEKLRLMRFARYDTGEVFAHFVTNRGLRGPVKLDIQVIESEQIANASLVQTGGEDEDDGIFYDAAGNPKAYRKLRAHPGDFDWLTLPTEYDDIPAEEVFHYFRPDRPGQTRGIPDITPSLVLFAELRRASAAVLAAYETAADHAALFTTPTLPDGTPQTGSELPETWDIISLEKRAGLVMPEGYDVKQLKAEQPTSHYEMFDNAKLREISRCLCVPMHIATLDARIANMSSSYVIGQMYTQERIVDRSVFDAFMDRAFENWLAEARLIDGYLPDLPANVLAQWGWPSLGHHADPQKVANALEKKLSIGMTTFPNEYAKDGLDWEEQQELAAKSFGISIDEYRELLRQKLFGPPPAEPPEETPEDNGDDDEEQPKSTPRNGNGRLAPN